MAMTWEEIKQLQLPKPAYIKIADSQLPRKFRRFHKIESRQFVCPKDKDGGLCYTCSRKER